MGQKRRHFISDIDEVNRTAICAYCGPTAVRPNSSARRLSCANAMRADKWKYALRTKYGLTLAQWDAMVIAQSGRCASCSDPMRNPHVDHDHLTGGVRALLCSPCNVGLGQFFDNPARLRAAAIYLETYPPQSREVSAIVQGG